MNWKISHVDEGLFKGASWETLSAQTRGQEPVILVMRLQELGWSVLHIFPPLGTIFRYVSVYPKLEEALSGWLIHETKKQKTKPLFMKALRTAGIRKADPEALYMGEYAKRMSGFGKSAGWELLKTGRHFSITVPTSKEEVALKHFSDQLSDFGDLAFKETAESIKLYDPFAPEEFLENSVTLFEDRGNPAFDGISKGAYKKFRQRQLDILNNEIDHAGKTGYLSVGVPLRYISSHPLMVHGFSSQSGIKVKLEGDKETVEYRVGSEIPDSHKLDSEVYLARARLVNILGDLKFYQSGFYELSESALEPTVRVELEHYMQDMETQFPVIAATAGINAR